MQRRPWSLQLSLVVILTIHNREKRVGLDLDKRTFACIMFRATPKDKLHIKPKLLFEMKMEYCIVCNHPHWILGDPIEFKQESFNPNDYYLSELYEMGYFEQFEDAGSR